MASGPIRERLADFEADNPAFVGTSARRRPDAISLDYLTCFAQGPVALGDNSEGPIAYAWRTRCIGNAVYTARAVSGGWDADILLFSYTGVPILELDAAFEQAGRVFVCAERATGASGAKEIWMYYYNTLAAEFQFVMIDAGHTPRAILDSVGDTNLSDILLFYKKDDEGVVYRQQRERYTVERGTPLSIDALFPRDAQMSYGPVLFSGVSESLSSGSTPHAEVGNIAIQMYDGHGYPVDFLNSSALTERFIPSPSSGIVDMYFSELVYGFSVEIANLWLPQFGGGSVSVRRAGASVGTANFSTPDVAGNPVGQAMLTVAGGFDRLTFLPPAGDHQAFFQNLSLRLSDMQIADVKANVCSHGPVAFDYTNNPAVARAVVDGVTVELRAPAGEPGIFRPMAWDSPEVPYYWRHDPDGVRFQSKPMDPAQLTTGNNGQQSVDCVITFNPPVSGIQVEGVGTVDFANRIKAYNSNGDLIADFEPTPPKAFATYTNPYYIFEADIATLVLHATPGAVFANDISWTMLKFKKPSDVSAADGGQMPVPYAFTGNPPEIPPGEFFLEDVVTTRDYRVRIVYSVRDAATGRYTVKTFESALYPIRMDTPVISVGSELLTGALDDVVLLYDAPVTSMALTGDIGTVELIDVVLVPPVQGIDDGVSLSGSIPADPSLEDVILITERQGLDQGVALAGELRDPELIDVVIPITVVESEPMTVTTALTGGTLVLA
jgi:hypothetical protein